MGSFTKVMQGSDGIVTVGGSAREEVQPGRLIGLIGKKRSGKTTVGNYLSTEYGFKQFAFADNLKKEALRMDPFIIDVQTRLSPLVRDIGWEYAKAIPPVRQFLQSFGETMRQVDSKYWIRDVMEDVANLMDDGENVVITDVRHENEAYDIAALGGRLISLEGRGFGEAGCVDSHPSEDVPTHLSDYDITNTLGRMDRLFISVDTVMARWDFGKAGVAQ